MITHADLKKGLTIILDDQPYEVLEAHSVKKARGRAVVQTKIKNLVNGSVFDRNFHQGDSFEEAKLSKIKAKFLYSHRDRYFFCKEGDPSQRFDLGSVQIGPQTKFFKANQVVEALIFNQKKINISLPIKVKLKVSQAPPGVKGNRAQSGTKIVTLETQARITVPLFVEQGDIVEINTETQEYVKRVE